jgi:regulatory protein
MPLITAFEPMARRKDRYVVQVDDKSFATVSLDVIQRLGLHIGEPLLEGTGAQLLDEAAALAAYDRALRMLAARGRSGRDMERRLVQKGEQRQHAAQAVEKLRSLGLIDDASFARTRARSKLTSGRGTRRVEMDLQQQGVERETARVAVKEVIVDSGIDMLEQAREAAQKKARSMTKLEPAVRHRRLYAFMARRGFAPDEIRKAVESALTSLGDKP